MIQVQKASWEIQGKNQGILHLSGVSLNQIIKHIKKEEQARRIAGKTSGALSRNGAKTGPDSKTQKRSGKDALH